MEKRASPNPDLPRCFAKTRSGTPCQRFPLTGRTRCRLHGGLSLRGSENSSFKTGKYSKFSMHIPPEFKTEEVLNIPPIPVGSVMHLIRVLSDEIPKIFTKKMGIQEALAINVELQALTKDVVKTFLEAHMRPPSFKGKKPDDL